MSSLRFKEFQISDFARIAMRDGAVLAHDMGLGKSLAAFSIPLIRDNVRRVLLVAPEALHLQLRETARDFFGLSVLPLMSQEDFSDWGLDHPASPLEPGERPTFFLSTYYALGHTAGDQWPADKDDDGEPVEVAQLLRRRRAMLLESGWHEDDTNHFTHTTTGTTLGLAQASLGIGETARYHDGHKVRCIWSPTLAQLIQIADAFDFVVVDEGTRLQSNDAHIATGVRMLNPRYRLVLTATPIKNRLESLFHLAHWAAGGTDEANPRWPYAGTSEDREKFAAQHLLSDRYLTREKAKVMELGKKTIVSRRSARITNLHRLWKIIAPVVLRRRKGDCGEGIVGKTTHVTKVPPGTDQWRVYKHYLTHPPKRKNALAAAGVQLTLLRQATVAPYTELMYKEGTQSSYVLNPKVSAILSLVEDCLGRGEQVVVGSNFGEFGSAIHRLLVEAGVWSCLLDGRVDPARRGRMAREFKNGQHSVLVAGIHAMGEGASFDRCPNLIMPSLDFAFDVNAQFVERIWRMTSTRPVNVYVLVTAGSVDEYLLEVFKEKSESSDLALDGALLAVDMDEASVEALLEKAVKGYKNHAATLDESVAHAEWPVTKVKLAEAQRKFAAVNNS